MKLVLFSLAVALVQLSCAPGIVLFVEIEPQPQIEFLLSWDWREEQMENYKWYTL